MPRIQVLTADGNLIEHDVPEGFSPSEEEIAQIINDAGLGATEETPQEPVPGMVDPATRAEPQDISVSGAFAKSAGIIGRAVADRTVDPFMTMLTLDPEVGTGARLLATGQAMANIAALSAAPMLLLAGAGAQAGMEALTGSSAAGRAAGAATEIGAGLPSLVKAARTGIKALRGRLAAPQAAMSEETASRGVQIGERVLDQVQAGSVISKTQIGKQFDVLEASIVSSTPQIAPGMAAYSDAQLIVSGADSLTGTAQLPPRAKALVKTINTLISKKKPIPMETVVSLREHLKTAAAAANKTGLQAGAESAKELKMVRQLATDVMKSATTQNLADQYTKLQGRYLNEIAVPREVIRKLLNRKTSPQAAFNTVFATNDPHILNNAYGFITKVPGGKQTLQFGFAEQINRTLMSEAVDQAAASRKVLAQLQDLRPRLQSLGLYTAEELDALTSLAQNKRGAGLLRDLAVDTQRGRAMMRGILGAGLASQIAANPMVVAAGAVAYSLPKLRRMMMMARGTREYSRMKILVLRDVAQSIAQMGAMPSIDVDFTPAVGIEPD